MPPDRTSGERGSANAARRRRICCSNAEFRETLAKVWDDDHWVTRGRVEQHQFQPQLLANCFRNPVPRELVGGASTLGGPGSNFSKFTVSAGPHDVFQVHRQIT